MIKFIQKDIRMIYFYSMKFDFLIMEIVKGFIDKTMSLPKNR
jgi:hypothetical protein